MSANAVVLALGPWSDDIFRPLGYDLPLGWKRGYHMHYRAKGNATLSRPVIDAESGFLMTPMTKGIRVTTGAEFALRDAPKTPVQLERVEPIARKMFPLGERVEAEPWLGRRPAMPDMVARHRAGAAAQGAMVFLRPSPSRLHAGACLQGACWRR